MLIFGMVTDTYGAVAPGAFLLMGGVIVFGVAGIIYDVQNCKRLFEECMDDGKKEYECAALLYSHNGRY